MKKLLTIIFLFCSLFAASQVTKVNVGTTGGDGTGDPLRTAFQKINVGIDTINAHTSRLALKANLTLVGLKLNISDTANMLIPYINRADTASMLTPYINRADTSAMLSHYITGAEVTSLLLGKVNVLDTASMLTPYINRSDTAAMLSPYVSRIEDIEAQLADTLNIDELGFITASDTAAMLSDYINKADTASMLNKYSRKLNPTFTGTVGLPATTSIGNVSSTEIGYLDNVTSAIQTQLNGKAATSHTQAQSTITNLSDSLLVRYTKTQANTKLNLKVNIADTSSMLGKYARKASPTFTGVPKIGSDAIATRQNINDSLDARLAEAEEGVALAEYPYGADTLYSYGIVRRNGLVDVQYQGLPIEMWVYDVDGDGELEELAAAVVAARGTFYVIIHVAGGAYNITAPIIINSQNENLIIDGQNTNLYVPHGYTGDAIQITPTDDLTEVKISGLRFNERYSSGVHADWTGIHIDIASDDDLQMSRFQDLIFWNCGQSFYVELNGTSWCNGNQFIDIQATAFKTFLNIDGSRKEEFSINYFNNIQLQATAITTSGIDTLWSDGNMFNNYVLWDATSGQKAFILGSTAVRNTFINGSFRNWENLSDLSNQNIIWGSYSTPDNNSVWQNMSVVSDSLNSKGITVTEGRVVHKKKNTGNIVASTGVTTDMLSRVMYYNGGSAIDISANPQIVAGYDGEMITIIGGSDTNTLKLDTSNGIYLSGGDSFTLGSGDTITLIYSSTHSRWLEISRSDN